MATVIDCRTKACIGYAMAEHMRTELVIAALDMAARNHCLADGVIFHSGCGTQYTSVAFAGATNNLGIRRSVGRTGVCFDNAQTGSFNATLKVEWVNRTIYPHPRTRPHRHCPVHRVPLQCQTSPLRTRAPDPHRGPRRVPEPAHAA